MLALITGATRGIGRATTLALSKLGYRTAFVARPSKHLENLLIELDGCRPIYVEGDLRDKQAIEALHVKIESEGLVPDLILLNAGIFIPGLVDELTPEQVQDALGHNFIPALETIAHWLDIMKQRKSGRIIFVGSIATRIHRPEAAPYVLSKALLTAYAELLFHSLRSHNVAITRIIPGAIDTDTWGDLDVPRERFIPAEDIAKIIVGITQLAPQTVPEEIIVRPSDPNW
jgi:NADP-dependent 3-hydroxy acid dehydrogenase YdfG